MSLKQPSEALSSLRLCLFSSFFTGHKLPYFVCFYLDQLLPFSSHLLLVTNDDRRLDDESQEWLAERAIELLYVKNEGYDFGMWQKALSHLTNLQQYDQLCLCNDSCICFAPLNQFFSWIDTSSPQAAGIIKSYEKSEHLQSYLLVFAGQAKRLAVQHLQKMDLNADYDDIVSRGELGLSKALREAGIPLDSYYEPTQATNENPSYIYCSTLLDNGMPLIKRKILGYPPGFVIKHALRHKKSILRREYYLKKILNLYPENLSAFSHLFKDLPAFNIAKEAELYRRIFKYWLKYIFNPDALK